MFSFALETKKGRVRITVSDDLDALFPIYAELSAPQPTAAVFAPSHLAFLDGFWIKGTAEPDGRLMHLQAVGLVDLGHQSLTRYLERNVDLYRPLDLALRPSACSFDSLGGRTISGLTCYHGELWMLGGPGGYQGVRLAERLTRFAVHLAHERFAPDYIWALMTEKKIRTRFHGRIGYARACPGGAVWKNAQGRTELEEFVVWSDHDDLVDLKCREADRELPLWLACDHRAARRLPSRRGDLGPSAAPLQLAGGA